jgi:hypothetical protein
MPLRSARVSVAIVSWTYLVAGCGAGTPDLGPKGDLYYEPPASAADAGLKDAHASNSPDAAKLDDAGSAADAGATGLPCDVDALLAKSCRACHGARPLANAPMPLVSYEDLLAPSKSVPSVSYAQLSLDQMNSGVMPVGRALATDVIAPFAAWVAAGTPRGNCGGSSDAGVADPYDTPTTCTSQKRWTGGDRESPLMHPGAACISCHKTMDGPPFSLAGTVYPTAHEPSDCNGSDASGASLTITDATGRAYTLTPNAAGNFLLETGIQAPYTAELSYQGRTRVMATPQTNGDCNSCHTEAGDQGAPGRIMLP